MLLIRTMSYIKANNSHGCEGGDPTAAYAWILQNGGIGDDTCTNYLAADQKCVPENVCRNCAPGKGCFAVTKYPEVSLIYISSPPVGVFPFEAPLKSERMLLLNFFTRT